VALVDKVADKKGTRKVAQAYLEHWYTPEAQEIAAKNFYRPIDPGGRGAPREGVREGEPVHHRPGVRRVAKSPEDSLRRRGTFDQIFQPGKK
jgi:sulfate transport system substrate-binding protein